MRFDMTEIYTNETDDGKPPQKRSKLLSFMGIDQSSLAQIPGYGRL